MILVTGAQGFIGSFLVEYLLAAGSRIRILTRGGSRRLHTTTGQVDVWQGNLTVANTISGIADGIDTVFHLAGEVRNAQKVTSVNLHGTMNLLAECQSSGVRRFL